MRKLTEYEEDMYYNKTVLLNVATFSHQNLQQWNYLMLNLEGL